MILNLILLWALHNALDRIESLEDNVYKVGTAQSKIIPKIRQSDDGKPYKKCDFCGAIVRTNASKCPKCDHPYEE